MPGPNTACREGPRATREAQGGPPLLLFGVIAFDSGCMAIDESQVHTTHNYDPVAALIKFRLVGGQHG